MHGAVADDSPGERGSAAPPAHPFADMSMACMGLSNSYSP